MSVEQAIEKMAKAFDEPYRWVCENGHIGDTGKKKKHSEVRTGVCAECGAPASLVSVTVSGKKRRPHSLKKFEHRDEVEREGPVKLVEDVPDDVDLGERFVEELGRGAHPILTLPKTDGLTPLQVGHIYEVGDVDIYVTDLRDNGLEMVVDYIAQRADQTVRGDFPLANPEANPERKATHQRGRVDARAEEEYPASPEAERLSPAEQVQVLRPKLEEKLERVRGQEERQETLTKELEADYSANVARAAREQVTRLKRIREATEEDIRNLGRHRREKGS